MQGNAPDEIERLRAVNAELVKALAELIVAAENDTGEFAASYRLAHACDRARFAIAKAEAGK